MYRKDLGSYFHDILHKPCADIFEDIVKQTLSFIHENRQKEKQLTKTKRVIKRVYDDLSVVLHKCVKKCIGDCVLIC